MMDCRVTEIQWYTRKKWVLPTNDVMPCWLWNDIVPGVALWHGRPEKLINMDENIYAVLSLGEFLRYWTMPIV